ncbi:MAG TPA: FAD-dependent oxidoreductase [Chitinophagaceae bacterium]|nr:FAD-dependent oxidoreductase [Chitinophagaceae bacterium]
MGKKIAVIGAGISGMSSAYLLAAQGHELHIISKSFSPDITSNRAAAFWFPYHIRNDRRGIDWCVKSYHFYEGLCGEETGISMKKIVKAVKNNTGDEDTWLDFMPGNTLAVLQEDKAPAGYDKAYEAYVPLIETQIFLPWLYKQVEAKGTTFKHQQIFDLHDLSSEYDAIINCSALGSRELCNDKTVIPVRGQVVLLEPGFPDHIFLDNQTPAYIVPRKDATIVGGTYEENVYDEKTEQESLDDILRRAYSVFPGLDKRKIIGNWAGLRPYRPEVRVEREKGTKIIHNYGHGGSGYTLAFGCAEEVTRLTEEL